MRARNAMRVPCRFAGKTASHEPRPSNPAVAMARVAHATAHALSYSAVPARYRRRAHSLITMPDAIASGRELFTP